MHPLVGNFGGAKVRIFPFRNAFPYKGLFSAWALSVLLMCISLACRICLLFPAPEYEQTIAPVLHCKCGLLCKKQFKTNE
jgi:hypothetical protein